MINGIPSTVSIPAGVTPASANRGGDIEMPSAPTGQAAARIAAQAQQSSGGFDKATAATIGAFTALCAGAGVGAANAASGSGLQAGLTVLSAAAGVLAVTLTCVSNSGPSSNASHSSGDTYNFG